MPNKFVILELIPTNTYEKGGKVVQISALKIEKTKIVDRFDYRLVDEVLPFPEIKKFINYDNDKFNYVKSDKQLWSSFKKFTKSLPIMILDDVYTPNYLCDFNNELLFLFKFLKMEYSKDIVDEMMHKYHLESTNYIVDLMYEALMMEN